MSVSRSRHSASSERRATKRATSQRPVDDPNPRTRWEAIWQARWYILVAAIAVGALAFLVSHLVPKRFSSSAIVRVTLPSSAGLSEQAVQASNDLASQYTQVATAGPIVARAAAKLGAQGHGLTGNVSASTVASQNLVEISARAGSATVAQDRANAMAKAFAHYLNRENARSANNSAGSSGKQLRRTQTRIQADELAIDTDLATREAGKPLTASQRAHLSSLESEVATLQSLQQSLLSAQIGAGTPTLSVFSPAGVGSQTQPRPTLYALVAFLVALLIASQIAIWRDGRAQSGD